MQIIAENDRGWIALDGNEMIVGSKIFDPPKVRLTSPVNTDGGGGGVISFNISRHAGAAIDGHDQDEMAMLRVEQAEDVRGQVGNPKAELNIMLADGSGVGDVVKLFAIVWNRVTRFLPEFAQSIRMTLGGAPPTPLFEFPNKLVSPDGRLELDIQNADEPGAVLYQDGIAIGAMTLFKH